MIKPFNDDFANSQTLTGATVQVVTYPLFSTGEAGEPQHLPAFQNRSVWYSWTAPFSGIGSVDSLYYSSPAVYVGDRLDQLVRIAGSTNNQIEFTAQSGVTYRIAINAHDQDPWSQYYSGYTLVNLGVRKPPLPTPDNDDFAKATLFTGYDGTLTSHLASASLEPGEPWPTIPSVVARSVWFRWRTPFSGLALVDLSPSTAGVLVAYRGNALTNLTQLAFASGGRLQFLAEAGTDYSIIVGDGGWPVSSGDEFDLRLYQVRPRLALPVGGDVLRGRDGVHLLAEIADAPTAVNSVEFFNGNVSLGSVIGGPFEFLWANPTAGPVELWARAVDDTGHGSDSPRVTVYVRPVNDDFVDRREISGEQGQTGGSTEYATVETNEGIAQGAGTNSVWFQWTPPRDGKLVVQANAAYAWPNFAPFVPRITIAEGPTLSALNVLAISGPPDAVGSPGPPQNVTVVAECRVTQQHTYAICVQGWTNISGPFELNWKFIPRAPNDDFARRISLIAPITMGSNVGATGEAGEPLPPTNSLAKSVWWTWTAPDTGDARLKVSGGFALAVFVGTAVDDLLRVATGVNGSEYIAGIPTPNNTVRFQAIRGVDYQIAVTDVGGYEGDFTLSLDSPQATPRIDPASPTVLPTGEFFLRLSGATGRPFVLQSSSNLVTWSDVLIDTFQGATFLYSESPSLLRPQSFYRVVPLVDALSPPLSASLLNVVPGATTTVRVVGPPGQPFRLQASEDLKQWEDLAGGIVVGFAADALDPTSGGESFRFYRVLPWR
ncbi:MAG: hypothetical protein DME19_19935 [Verrucomicrobia bacterium]|nr:MAG: hypothetical protein DME19_19935 [Verrucomicrobiota bacterium]